MPLALPALVLGAMAIGFSPILVRLSELGPTATGFHRVLLALPLLWLWMRWEARARRDDSVDPPSRSPLRRAKEGRRRIGPLLVPGLLFAGDLFFWHWSVAFTTVANATLFANFAPIIVVVGAWFVLGESITRRFLAGMVLALVGAMMLLGSSVELGGRYVLGDGLGLATACFYGAYMIALARLRGRYGAATIMFWSSLVTSLALLPVAWLSGESVVAHSASGWLVLIALAWIGQAMGQGLIAYALGHLPASFSSLAVLVQPVTAAVLGWLLLGEALGRLQIVGGITILAGILVARAAGQRDSAV